MYFYYICKNMIKNYQLCDGTIIMKFGGGFMKNPNGFGSVTRLSGKRRKPWVAKVTVGFDQNTGKQIQKSIGTFATRADAMKQLSLYQVSKKSKHLALEMDYEMQKKFKRKLKYLIRLKNVLEVILKERKMKSLNHGMRIDMPLVMYYLI